MVAARNYHSIISMNSGKSKVAGWSSCSIPTPSAQSDTGSALGRTGFQAASAPALHLLEIAWPQQISPPGNPHLSLRARCMWMPLPLPSMHRYISNMTAIRACIPHTDLAHTAYKCIRGVPVLDPGRRSGDEEDQEDQRTRRPAGPGEQICFLIPNIFLLATYINLQLYLGNCRLSKLAWLWLWQINDHGPVFLHPPTRSDKVGKAKLLERSQVYHLFHVQILCQACSKELQTVS